MAGDPAARHPEGMAKRNAAAIDVELRRVDFELVAAVDHLAGEGFVDFPQADVFDLQSRPVE